MNGVADNAVGAILEIPPKALQDIDKAERAIKQLALTSAEAAGKVNDHWGIVAPHGLQQFIDKIAQTQEAIKSLGGSTTDIKFNTESATQQMSNFTEKVQSDSFKISQSIQDLSSIPIDAKGIKEWAETSNKTFGDVLGMIKGLKNGLREMGTESPTTQAQLQAIKAWEDYYKSVSKVNEEKDKMARKTADIERAISNVRAQIDHENQAWERSKTKVAELQAQMDAFNKVNPNFSYLKSTFELDELKSKLLELQHIRYNASEENKPLYDFKIEATKKQIDELTAKMAEYSRIYDELSRAQKGPNTEELTKKLSELEQKLTSARSAQASFNAELEKGNTAKSLASEYAKLTKRLQEVNDAMNKFQSAGGNVTSASFQSLQTEWQNIMARRKEIEKMDIAEVNQYRTQMAQSAYQADLSAFIQNEAQKTAEAKRQAEIQSKDRLQAYQQYFNTYQGAMAAVNRLGTRGGDWTDSYENRARVIKNLEAAIRSLKTTDADYEKKLNNLTTALNNLKNKQQEVNNAMTSQPKPNVADAQWLANVARGTKTLEDYKRAYDVLIEVMSRTPKNSTDFKNMSKDAQDMKRNIEEVEKAMAKFRNQSKETSNVMGQLQGRIAAAFSVGAITGFIKKMVDVRAQFELQRVALGAIIQDRDEANKIFTQVQNMALESPFNIMQLEKATKQIAAFGFETQKLVPTMKMFADISAGLGVEIDRLVLVMGHLKARNFLEGTMVRQFTNMGFNVLGELSKYYSELEDRMVSVGEVQDRVKKKMISFEDVEEVLKRVTSAGGMFYDMQKKQSESLWGQMQRIQDAYDLMLNEIGQSNEGILKSALSTIRSLINNWRALKPIIVSVVAAMGAFGAYMLIFRGIPAIFISASRAVNMMATALGIATKQQLALNAAQKANAWGMLLSLIVAVGVALYEVATTTSKLNEELNRIGSETTDSLNESIVTFKTLADTISDTNSTYTERTEAMNEMRRVYADILPKEKLEIDYIQSLRGNYAELTKTIQDYYQQKEYNQKVEAIQGSPEAQAVQKQLEETLNRMNEEGAFDMKYSKAMIKSWSDTIAKEINTGKIPATLDSLEARIKEVFNAKDISLFRGETYGKADLTDVLQAEKKVQEAYGDITLDTANAENALASYQEQYKHFDFSQLDEAKKSLQEQKESLQQMIDSGIKGFQGTAGGRHIYGTMQMDASEIEALQERLKMVETQIQAVDEAERQWLSNQFKEKVEELNQVLFKDVEAYKAAQNEMRKLEMQGKKNTDEWKKQEKAMNDARVSADKTAKTYGTTVNWALIDSAQTSFELRGELNKLATKAFPKVAELAMKSLSKLQEYLLRSKNTVYEWVKGLLEWVPESARNALGLNTILTNVDKNLALTKTQLDNLAKTAKDVGDNAEDAGNSFDKLISDKAKSRVKEFGGNITDIDRIISDTSKGADNMAKELRSQAKTWEETAKSYRTSTDKALWLNTRHMTEESIALMEKNAKAAKALATDLAGVDKSEKSKKGAKGKDEILELWKNRLDALKRYYDAAEKARKHLSESETKVQQTTSFEKLWYELGFDKVKGLDLNTLLSQGFDPNLLKENYVEALKRLKDAIPPKYAELKKDIEKVIASEAIEIQFKIKEKEAEHLKKQLDDMFASYELSKELKKLGLNVDLTFMFGGEPLDLNDLRAKVTKMYQDAGGEKASENEVKEYRDRLKKIEELELKERKERVKEYHKYFVKTVGERAQIELEYLKKMDDVRQMYEFTDAQRQDALRQLTEEKNRKLSEQVWKDFKDGSIYQMMFQDLDAVSEKTLVTMRTELERIRDSFKNLSPKDLKEINKAIQDIDNQIAARNPFKTLGNSFKDLIKFSKERKRLEKDYQDAIKRSGELADEIFQKETKLAQLRDKSALYKADQVQSQIDNLKNQIAELEKDGVTPEEQAKIDALNEQIRLLEEKKKKLQEIAALNKKEEDSMYSEIKGLESDVAGLNAELGESNNKAEESGKKLSKGAQKANDISTAFSKIRQKAEEMRTELNGIIDGLDRMGVLSDAFRDTWESINDIFTSTMDFAEGGIQAVVGFMTQDYASGVTGILKSIKGVIGVIASAFEIGDKKKERQIKSLQESVESLDKAYQKLEKSMNDAYTFSQYNAEFDKAKQNLDEQKKAYQEMKALEESKKKSDKEKVKEYTEKLEEIAEKEEELRKQRIEAMGSTTDYLNEAQSFVDAWLDAYKETGSGLDALSESWDEFIENLFVKQGAAQIVSARLKKVIDDVNAAIEAGGTDFDLSDAVNKAREDWKKEAEIIEPLLEQLFGSYGLGKGNGDFILSDLQKGIQNITEPQAAAIEAYLNSMRFAVFHHTEQLDTLIATIQMQYGSGTENPVVTELKGIRGVLDNIYSTLKSVVSTKMGQPGILIAGN